MKVVSLPRWKKLVKVVVNFNGYSYSGYVLSTGNVSQHSDATQAGGLVGYLEGSTSFINNSFATGNVSGIFWLLKDDREYLINRLNFIADDLGVEIFRPIEFLKEMAIPSARKVLKARKRKRREQENQNDKK